MPFQDMSKYGMRPAGSSAGGLLEGILKGVEAALPAWKEAKEQTAKREKDKADMYIDLRKAGYSKTQAYEKTNKSLGKFEKPEEDYLDLDREGKEADIEYKKSRSEYYKSKAGEEGSPAKPSDISNKIKMKLYNKEPLTEKEYSYATEVMDQYIPDEMIPETIKAAGKASGAKEPKKEPFWAKLFGQKEKRVEEKAAAVGKEPKEITLPDDITKTSEAVDYLMKTYKMSREKAIAWIKKM